MSRKKRPKADGSQTAGTFKGWLKKLAAFRGRVAARTWVPLAWQRFVAKHPALREHLKPYRTPAQLVGKLQAQGLAIANNAATERLIFTQNYFRLKAYFKPFIDEVTGDFYPGTTFAQVESVYEADQRIRDFLLPLLARQEVRIRGVLDNVVTSVTGDPFWHLDAAYFSNYERVRIALETASRRFNSGKQEFAIHYRNKYYTRASYHFRRVPPFWILSEMLTIEQLLSVASGLDKEKFAVSAGVNRLNECATPFGFDSYGSLVTNLKCLLELRNICAHHSRLWNKNLQGPNAIAKHMSIKPGKTNRLYGQLVMLRIMCKAQGIPDGIEPFFSGLLAVEPTMLRQMGSMGFPPNWQTDPLWI